MAWGGISIRGKTDLVFVNGNMNAQRYIDQVHQPVVQPYVANNAEDITLMDDNARPHRARIFMISCTTTTAIGWTPGQCVAQISIPSNTVGMR